MNKEMKREPTPGSGLRMGQAMSSSIHLGKEEIEKLAVRSGDGKLWTCCAHAAFK